jgi:hypothetical protein
MSRLRHNVCDVEQHCAFGDFSGIVVWIKQVFNIPFLALQFSRFSFLKTKI